MAHDLKQRGSYSENDHKYQVQLRSRVQSRRHQVFDNAQGECVLRSVRVHT
jgi:hypothetical protein